MQDKYVQAIKAGVICGILLAVIAVSVLMIGRFVLSPPLENMIGQYENTGAWPLDLSGYPPEIFISGLLFVIAVMLGCYIFFASGVLAAWLITPLIKDKNDVLVPGAISGAITGVIPGLVWVVTTFILNIIDPVPGYGMKDVVYGIGAELICCSPVILVLSIVIAVAGTLAYTVLKIKT